MPAILHPDDEARWLEPSNQVPSRLLPLLRPYPSEEMEAYPVESATGASPSRNERPVQKPEPAAVATQGVLSL